jgi:hypothetical protein
MIYSAPSAGDNRARGNLRDQTACRSFQLPVEVTLLSDSQLAPLKVAFSESNFGKNITISKSENSSDKLRETARLINSKLGFDCPTGLELDLFHLWSSESNNKVYHSQCKSVKGTASLPVKPEALSYIDSGDICCLLIDVKTANGQTARVDILNVNYALEQEYLDRANNKLLSDHAAGASP